MHGFNVLDPKLNLKRNCFIEASAGTGKTYAIENTVVRLIQEQIPVDRILVVTFTRAATLELKMRIRRNLEEKNMKREVMAFDEAKIFTIHGFCFHTLKEHAIETGFYFNQREEKVSIEVFKTIFKDFMRAELRADEMHPRQLELIFNQFQNNIDKLANEMLKPHSDIGKSFSELLQEVALELKELAFEENSILEALIQYAPLFSKMCDRKRQLKIDIKESLKRFSKNFATLEIQNLFEHSILRMVPENLLQGNNGYPEILSQLNKKLIPLLALLSDSENALNYLKYRFHQHLTHVSKEEDLFFYDDLLKCMYKQVQNSHFAEKVRASYQIVLIDEFQDTDRIQWEIFSKLFLGHLPLYLVGDPKQSIYRFRGADLYTYLEAKKSMGEAAYTTLTHNFRSQPGLIEGLNLLFSRTTDLITLPKSNQTIPIPHIVAALPETQENGKIIFCKTPDEHTFFCFVINEIARLNKEHKISFKECAVLVKDHYQAKRFCSLSPLPYATRKTETLLGSEGLSILEDILKAVSNPRERKYIVKALGGPLFGISLENMHEEYGKKVKFFHEYHQILKAKGILYFFKKFATDVCFPSEALYLDLLQLVELIAENAFNFEAYLPFLQKIKLEDPDAEKLKIRAKTCGDAIQVMTTHVSKGLEFTIVFPAGLISSYDMQEEENISENMRQMYVALTRAKTRLYLPIIEKENTPIQMLLKNVLQGDSLELFIASHPNYMLIDCEKESFDKIPPKQYAKPLLDKMKPPELKFSSSEIYSYSGLSKNHHKLTENFFNFSEKGFFQANDSVFTNDSLCLCEQKMPEKIPLGSKTGRLLHHMFESLDFGIKGEKLKNWIANQINGTGLEPWLLDIEKMISTALNFPLQGLSGNFCLANVDAQKMKREMEFLYASSDPNGYIKGFIDLFFEFDNYYYIIDWKSNFLHSYTQESLKEAMTAYDYTLQAELYKTAAIHYLKLFNAEQRFGGIFYIFLRGLDIDKNTGIYEVRWNRQ